MLMVQKFRGFYTSSVVVKNTSPLFAGLFHTWQVVTAEFLNYQQYCSIPTPGGFEDILQIFTLKIGEMIQFD